MSQSPNVKLNGLNNPMEQTEQKSQPKVVRHIPIFVEGRDEPIINKNISTPDRVDTSSSTSRSPSANEMPKSSIFERVKNFPVRIPEPEIQTRVRTNSLGKTIPVNVTQQRSSGCESPKNSQHTELYDESNNSKNNQSRDGSVESVNKELPPVDDTITKIKYIQKEVYGLIDRLDGFDGACRKEYLYLDEMFTQNLLKLDVIETDGKETIKQARRYTIKCINQCISVLEERRAAAEKKSCSCKSQNSKSNEQAVNNDKASESDNKNTNNNCSYCNKNMVNVLKSNEEIAAAAAAATAAIETAASPSQE